MTDNSQSRKWSLTINNPTEAGFTHEKIEEILSRFSLRYYCLSDERATTGTFHTHIFLMSESPIRFATLKSRFPVAHLDKAYGTAQENRDYIRKEGKWKDSEKAETSISGSFLERGVLPSPKEEKAPLMAQLLQDVQSGKTITEIVNENPSFAFRIKDIELLRQTFLSERYAEEMRDVAVTYLFGATGVGKTFGIYKKYDAHDICRVTSYRGSNGINFDGYTCQDILVFEEFAGQIAIEDMLNFLDRYPLRLPARYNDRIACFTKVFITSNQAIEKLYRDAQINRPETWRAFLRRVDNIVEFLPDGTTRVLKGEWTK